MAPKTPRKILQDILEDLTEINFKKFCSELLGRRDGVKRSQVEGKDFLVVTDVMTSAFTEKKVLKVAEEILREIGCGQHAENLVAEAKKAGLQISADASSDEKHFVDKHMVDLIQRVTSIPPILDKLLKANVVKSEDYEDIMAKLTSQTRMRALYSGPLKAGRNAKDIFLQILKEEQPFLIEDLMKQ